MRLIRLNSSKKVIDHFDGEVIIGRTDPNERLEIPKILFDEDLQVSRNHVKIWIAEDGQMYIQDLSSYNGTFLYNQETKIKLTETIELIPGTTIRTGDSLWTVIPDDWLLFYTNDIVAYVPYVNVIGYVNYHCKVPILGDLTIHNIGKQNLTSLRVSIYVEEYCSFNLNIPSLAFRERKIIQDPDLQFEPQKLKAQKSHFNTNIRLEIESVNSIRTESPITISGFYSWSLKKHPIKTLAAFVSPGNPAVESIINQANKLIRNHDQSGSFKEWIRSGISDVEQKVMLSIYDYLSEECNLKWYPPVSVNNLQEIKLPHHIFEDDTNYSHGEGTCIDFSLLLASCFENVGLCPVIFIVGNDKDQCHSFVGCWAGLRPGSRPVIYNRQYLIDEVNSENLFILESTGIAEKQENTSKLSFNDAVSSASKVLYNDKNWSWIRAVDIMALRPPQGIIAAIDFPFEPEVLKIHQIAKEFAILQKCPTLEIIHLLYGCLQANGKVIQKLLSEFNINGQNISHFIEEISHGVLSDSEPQKTINYTSCENRANMVSQDSGCRFVREQDILYAIFENKSKNLTGTLNRFNIYPKKIIDFLERNFYQNGLGNIHSFKIFKSTKIIEDSD